MKTSVAVAVGEDVCPWDVTEDSEDDEDWLFSSISQYEQLHMFQLSVRAAQMSLSPDGCHLALAGSGRASLEVYRLPGKLVAASSEEEGLTSNRDFTLVCGSVESPAVSSLQYVGRRRLVTTTSDSRALSLWSWQAGEDLLQLTGEVDIGQFQPRAVEVVGQEENLLVWGENGLARTDLAGLVVDRREVGGEIQTVMTEGSVTWCLETSGDLSSVDWRQSNTVLHHNIHQTLSQSCFFQRGASTFLAGQSEAALSVWDVRASRPVEEVSLARPGRPGGHIVADREKIVVSEGPAVNIYSDDLRVVFSHEAHRAEICCLLTHPAVKNLVISADTNNRLQAWVFNSKNLT